MFSLFFILSLYLLRRIGEIGKHNLSCLIEGMLDSRVGNSAIPYELRDVNPKPYLSEEDQEYLYYVTCDDMALCDEVNYELHIDSEDAREKFLKLGMIELK